ncbi:hypothetical protein F4680DRAFT_414760 [Xylaria scruposa]|nr:hypothetical protein F4680DRAFT_414760 [Xylaria scruposa]
MALPPRKLPPLLLDRVIEGRDIASPSSILFTIPREILCLIIGYVASDKMDLASLALVNSTCRQLARSCQFNYLHIDYSPTALKILAMLQGEALQRYRSSDRMTVSSSLGACVRQLKVDTGNYWPRLKSMLPPDFIGASAGPDEKEVERARCISSTLGEFINHLYWPAALQIISTLPNLQSLCVSGCATDDGLVDCLTGLSIRNLELKGDLLRIPNTRTKQNSYPLGNTLETLILETSWEIDFSPNNPNSTRLDASGFYRTLLASCCSNLRRLEFSHRRANPFKNFKMPGIIELTDMPLSFYMEFPKLKTLHIGSFTLVDAQVVSCLVREGLTSLGIPYDNDTSQFLSEIGQIHSLDTISLECFEATGATLTRFIEANTQIRSLAVSWTVDAFLGRIIQSLHYHGKLKRLSLAWRETEIPETSLEKVSLLSSIEILHLSAGDQSGWPHNWFVDHDKIKTYVSRLSKLRRLIITRDTYPLPPDDVALFEPGRYYDFRKPGSRFWTSHETRMYQHAVAYVQTHPVLEFLHIGQVLFAVEENGGHRRPVVAGSAWVGETEYNVLKEEFGVRDSSF